jgi:hypothetical protein
MWNLLIYLGAFVACALVMLEARGQDGGPGVIFFQHRQFRIPFKNDQKNVNVTQVRLYVSTDFGKTWKYTGAATPEEQGFRFSTPIDGLYWFAVQTTDQQGKLYPTSLDELKPNLRVIVDATPPQVQVQRLPPRGNEVGVAWTIRDDNLDLSLPDAVRVEYRQPGAANWTPLSPLIGTGQIYWAPPGNGNYEVRVLARDRAGNVGEDKTTVSLQGGGGFNPPPLQNPFDQRPNEILNLERKFVNSKQINLSYDLRDVGPSGVSAVELWYTLYKGRTWNKLTEYPIDARGPDANLSKKLSFEVNEEGIYGISLVAKSGVGLGERPPQAGDRPQFWLEVDLTKPVAQILGVHVGTGIDKGNLAIAWKADDKNLGPAPIRLSYAEQKEGPWTTFADRLANNGKHVWKMPDQLPFQFYVRVEAIDLAGNIGEAITFDRVKVDLSLPKAQILKVEPGAP